jgi:hypothetical protein
MGVVFVMVVVAPGSGASGCDPGAAWIRGLLSKQPATSSCKGSASDLDSETQEVVGSRLRA